MELSRDKSSKLIKNSLDFPDVHGATRPPSWRDILRYHYVSVVGNHHHSRTENVYVLNFVPNSKLSGRMLLLLAQVSVTQVLLLDVAPLSLGIETARGVIMPLPLGRCYRKE
jgi:hypothetical protein